MATAAYSTSSRSSHDAAIVDAYRCLEYTFHDVVALALAAEMALDRVLDPQNRQAKGHDHVILTLTIEEENVLQFLVNRLVLELRQAKETYHDRLGPSVKVAA